MATLTKNVNVHISNEQYHYLQQIAKEKHKSISAVIRDAVSQTYDIKKSEQIELADSIDENESNQIDQKKKRQLEAFEKARGIWKDRPEVDAVFKEIDERWKQWERDLEKSA